MTMETKQKQIETCEICGPNSPWEGEPTLWGCEGTCGITFCEKCFSNKHGAKAAHDMFSMDGSIENVLCPNCYQRKEKNCHQKRKHETTGDSCRHNQEKVKGLVTLTQDPVLTKEQISAFAKLARDLNVPIR